MNEYTIITEILFSIILTIESEEDVSISYISSKYNIKPESVRRIIRETSQYLTDFTVFIDNIEFKTFYEINQREYDYGQFDNSTISLKTDFIILDQRYAEKYRKLIDKLSSDTAASDAYIFKTGYNSIRQKASFADYSIAQELSQYSLDEYDYNRFLCCKTQDNPNKTIYILGVYYFPVSYEFYVYALDEDCILRFFPVSSLYYLSSKNKNYNRPDYLSRKDIIKAREIVRKIWAPEEISVNAETTHYIIQVKNEHNPKKKILHDLSCFNPSIKECKNGELTITFELFATDSLFSWLLSYGSSITVIEPKEVAFAILSTYKNTIKGNTP